jgi:iron(III) transport system substrate-binding protein
VRHRGSIAVAVVAAVLATAAASAAAPKAETLTVYSGRNEVFVKPLVERFTRDTGIAVQVRYGDSAALAATILEEGKNSPADVFFSQEAGALGAVANEALLAKLPAKTLRRVQPRFRSPSGMWVGTSARARVVAYDTGKLSPSQLPTSIFGFTQARWKGKIGLAPTNASFQAYVTALRLVHGDDRARDWLVALKANDAKHFPNNLSILQAIARGEIEVGFVNHYYLFQLKAQQPAAPVANHFLGKGDPGALVNAAGVGILKTSKQKATAQKFVDFLHSDWAQHNVARGPGNAEYPVTTAVARRPGLPAISKIEGPAINLGRLGRELPRTLQLLNEVGYTR